MNKIPDEVWAEMRDMADRREDEYADNWRACVRGDAEGEQKFAEIEAHGCCGSYDGEIIVGGVLYHVGWNYGH